MSVAPAAPALRQISRLHGTIVRLAGADRQVSILSYHAITPEPHRFAITPEAFRRHVELLARDYRVIALRDLLDRDRWPRVGERVVVITFDDAYEHLLEAAYPTLRAHGLPATIFAPAALLGRFNEWDVRKGLAPRWPIMTGAQLHQLSGEGLIEIGSHTMDHVSMRRLPEVEMTRQALESRQVLEREVGAPVVSFAYPYGQLHDYSEATRRVLERAGYRIAVTAHWGTRQRFGQTMTLRRIFLIESDDERTVRAKIDGEFDWIAAKERLAYMVRSATRALPLN